MWGTKAYDLESLKRKFGEVFIALDEAQEAHKAITESGEDPDNFSETLGRELRQIKDEVAEIDAGVKTLYDRFAKNLDFYQVDPKSDIRKSAPEFFTCFKKFTKDIEDSLPKIDPKKKKWPTAQQNQNLVIQWTDNYVKDESLSADKINLL